MRKRRFLFLFLISVACLFGFTNNVKADKKGSFNVKNVTSDSATIVWSGEENMNDIGVYPAKYEDGKCTDSGSRVARKSSPSKEGSFEAKKLNPDSYYLVVFKWKSNQMTYQCFKTGSNGKAGNTKVWVKGFDNGENNFSQNDNLDENGVSVVRSTAVQSRTINTGKFCDDDLKAIIHEYWNYIMLLSPILLIVLLVIDGIKCITSGTADKIKKYSNDAVKRVMATVILLALPSIISMIMSWFGLGDKICF